MMERKILDLAKPILSTWPAESHLESMILLQENAIEWMFDNYINLLGSWNYSLKASYLEFIPFSNPTRHDITLSAWAKCPFLEVWYVSHNYVRNKFKNILEYIMYAIGEGYYLYMDMYQDIFLTRMSLKYHLTFIYGFDRRRRIIYVADHYNHGKYALSEVTFDEFLKAYEITYWDNSNGNLLESSKEMSKEQKVITIARAKPFNYKFNKEWFKLQLSDYLESTYRLHGVSSVPEQENHKRYFGISNYDLVLYLIDKLIEKEENIKNDCRIFTLMRDHKTLLKMRLDFFEERGICCIGDKEITKSNEILKSSEFVLNHFLKYSVTGKEMELNMMKEKLLDMKKTEFELLGKLLNKL